MADFFVARALFIMTYLAACLIVVAAVALAIGANSLAGRSVTIAMRRQHHEVGSPVFSQVGTLIAVLLAFVFSSVWSDYGMAAQAINGECGALHGAVIMAKALSDGRGAPVNVAISNYARDVIDPEWSLMGKRHRSLLAAAAIEAAIDSAARVQVSQPSDAATKAQILELLAVAHADRETRLFQMNQAIPFMMWFVLISISVVLVLFVAFAGVEDPGRTLFTAVFAGAIALVLVLVRMLDFPFEGALALPPDDFVKLLSQARGHL